jgi:GH25 family lysozyme M1 (1,4-beta-N-acetylmuramidase)
MDGFVLRMGHVCLGPDQVGGYDVSHWQKNLAIHNQMQVQGKKICMIKSNEGLIVDDMLVKHYTAAKAAGMLVGFYDFFHPLVDPVAQASRMKSLIGNMHDDLGCAIDAETTDNVPAFTDREHCFQFLMAVKSETKKNPWFYSYPYFAQALGLDSRFAQFMLWISHMGVACPLIPAPWKVCTMHQYSNSNGLLDLNHFNGNMDQLMRIANATV